MELYIKFRAIMDVLSYYVFWGGLIILLVIGAITWVVNLIRKGARQ